MKRFLTGFGIVAALVLSFLLREVNLFIFDVCMGVVTVFGAMEVAKMLAKANKDCSVFAITLFPVFVYMWLILSVALSYSLLVILLGVMVEFIVGVLIVFVVYMCQHIKTTARLQVANYTGSKIKFSLKSSLNTAFAFIYPTFFILITILFNHIGNFTAELSNVELFTSANIDLGLIILVALFGSTMASDTIAYYVGCLIKGKKLCPKISPNKTISGSIGGFIGSILFVIIAYILLRTNYELASIFDSIGINYFTVVVFGFVASLATQLGDLFESYLKRKADVKDSGTILPGHGGIMDRCDGLCFNAVWVLLFFVIVL